MITRKVVVLAAIAVGSLVALALYLYLLALIARERIEDCIEEITKSITPFPFW